MAFARQAVVLAAGRGSRLAPLTDDTPKCLLEVGGRTLLDRMIDSLAEAGVERLVMVVGWRKERIERHLCSRELQLRIEFVENRRFDETNNAVSLQCARPLLQPADFLLCDADVIFSESPFPELQGASDSALALDSRVVLGEEEMKARVQNGRVVSLSKTLDPSQCDGESIGVQKIAADAADQLWRELEAMMAEGRQEAYYEEAFQRLIDAGFPFRVVPVRGCWSEIDTIVDLEDARARFIGERPARSTR